MFFLLTYLLNPKAFQKFCEVTILCSVKWIFYVMRSEYSVQVIFYLLCMQSLIYIILCRCAQAKWFLNELQPRVGPFSSINFDELLSFINCTCFSVPISSITFAFHICVSILESAFSMVLGGFFSPKVLTIFYDWVVGSQGLAHACFQSPATARNETLRDIIVRI